MYQGHARANIEANHGPLTSSLASYKIKTDSYVCK